MFREFVERLRSSLFFIPSLFLVGSVFLAWGVVALDRAAVASDAFFLLPTSLDGARAVLGTIAGATITVAALVFSLTAVTVQLASSQYSPRVLSEFLSDRFQQAVVGIVAGTFTFSLIALGTIGAGAAEFTGVTAPWAATTATVLGVTTVVAIVAFIDHVVSRLHVDDTIRRLSRATASQLAKVFRDASDDSEASGWAPPDSLTPTLVEATETGWVQRIDTAALLGKLGAADVAVIEARSGQYVVEGEPLITVWNEHRTSENAPSALGDAVQIGEYRTIHQDPAFGLRQLIDIALRALSPGVNDPTTAGDVLHHIVDPLSVVVAGPPRRRVVTSAHGARVVLPNELDQAEIVRAAYSEIRLASGGQTHVAHAMARSLLALRRLANSDLARRALDEQFELLMAEVESWRLAASDVAATLATADQYRALRGDGGAGFATSADG